MRPRHTFSASCFAYIASLSPLRRSCPGRSLGRSASDEIAVNANWGTKDRCMVYRGPPGARTPSESKASASARTGRSRRDISRPAFRNARKCNRHIRWRHSCDSPAMNNLSDRCRVTDSSKTDHAGHALTEPTWSMPARIMAHSFANRAIVSARPTTALASTP